MVRKPREKIILFALLMFVPVTLFSYTTKSANPSKVPALKRTGKIPYKARWVSVVKKGKIFKYKRKEFSSPRIHDDLIYVGADSGVFYAMKKKNGRKVWRFKTEGAVNSAPAFAAPAFAAPALSEAGSVIFGDDKGVLYSLEAKTGKEIWKSLLDSEILTAPVVSGDRVFVATVEGKVFAMNLTDGQMIWQKEHTITGNPMTIRGNSPPIVDGAGRLYVGFSDGTLWALSTTDGKLIWEKTFRKEGAGFSDIDGEPLVDQDRLYMATFDGGIFALSKKDGKTLWSQEIGSGVRIMAEGDVIYVSGSNGRLYALNKKDGSKIWDAWFGKGALTAPVLYKGIIAVGLSEQTMNFVRASDGKPLALRFAKKGVFSDPIIDDGKLYYLSNGGRLYSLRLVP